MMDAPGHISPLLDYGVAAQALPGQRVSGDQHVVKQFRGGALVAVIDGLGHGDEAAFAAAIAARTLEDHAEEPVIALIERCHAGLRRSRGAVMTLASLRDADGMMSWIGVGDVEGVLLRCNAAPDTRREFIIGRSGVVGQQLPPLRASAVRVHRGDLLVLATDGIRSSFAGTIVGTEPPQPFAARILAQYAKTTDDALVLVARLDGPSDAGDGRLPAQRVSPASDGARGPGTT